MPNGKCEQNYYFSKIVGRCTSCDELCKIPDQYPTSCQEKCPDYIPYDHVTAQLPLTTPSSGDDNWKSAVSIGSATLVAFLVVAFIIYLRRGVLKRRALQCARHLQNRREKYPVQEQIDNETRIEMDALTNPNVNMHTNDVESVGSVADDLEGNDTVFLDVTEANGSNLVSTDGELDSIRIDQPDISFQSENEYRSWDFNFGYTFPFNDVESLSDIFGHSGDQTRKKVEL